MSSQAEQITTATNQEERISFGEFTLDLKQRLLYRYGVLLKVRPKLLDLLVLLVERRGTVVSNDEIIRYVWPKTIVEESGLTRNVSLLRKCLGCVDGKYIENVPRRGYRFAAPITNEAAARALIPERFSSDVVNDTVNASIELPRAVSLSGEVHTPRRIAFKIWMVVVGVLTLTVAYLWHAKTQQSSFQAVQLTTNAPDLPIISAAISPDGRYLAYGEASHLYVKQVGSVDSHELQTPADAYSSYVNWFADNNSLLVSGFQTSSRKSAIWVTSVLGGAPRVLFTEATMASLSRGTNAVAFVRNRNELWLANADGTGARLFVTVPSARIRFPPQFSDDGKFLVVGIERDSDSHTLIRSYRIADGKSAELLDPSQSVMDMIVTKHDQLVMSSLIDDEVSTELTRAHIDFVESKLQSPETLLQWNDAESHGLQASTDGNQVSLIKNRTQADVYVAELTGNGVELSNMKRLTLDDSRDRLSGWLADSRTVLFHSNRSGQYGIYRQSVDDLRAQPLVIDDRDNFRAVVTPDQNYLWYYSSPPNEFSPIDLIRRPLGGGEPLILKSHPGLGQGLRCATRDACVRMQSENGIRVFYSFDPLTGEGRELARAPASDGGSHEWDLSPDGSKLALIMSRHHAITIMDVNERLTKYSELSIPKGHPSIYSIAWDASGQGLYVVCFDELDAALLHVSLEGNVDVMLHRPNDPIRWVIPSPDGKYLAIQAWTNASNVWMVRARK